MEKEQILARLADPTTPFLEKLRFATHLEVDLWEDRNPPNLGENELKKLMGHIPATIQPTWSLRDSKSGKHGLTGDDEVFKFEFSTKLVGFETTYFVKGYFLIKATATELCIQSFREVKRVKLNKLRLLKIK
ncbi:MAG: hypothetical protein ACK5WZ_04865 [Pseudobdellovibrionaceae bacterium]